MRLLFIIDPLASLGLAGDTSYALMLAAAQGGHAVYTCELSGLALEHQRAFAAAVPTSVELADTPAQAFRTSAAEYRALADFDAVLMRKDPPFDVNYLHATWILDHARGETMLINDPAGLRELNEHLAVLRFPHLTPPTLVTRDAGRLQAFLREQGGAMVLKPVDGFGGLGIFLVRQGDPNTSSLLETATGAGTRWTLAQGYLPAAAAGDKRILLVDGEPIGAVLRVPAAQEARGNLHVGGTAVQADLDDRDREIIAAIAPTFARYGQFFVGIDVIGGMLTEINITSPTGIRHIERLNKTPLAAAVIEKIQARSPGFRTAKSSS